MLIFHILNMDVRDFLRGNQIEQELIFKLDKKRGLYSNIDNTLPIDEQLDYLFDIIN